ncbi:MAG: preprotein translocase subunit SecE [Clostridiaceae bacterium]|nr:preprotein translocase subunit SecE [Clostridiaceae bacterium]
MATDKKNMKTGDGKAGGKKIGDGKVGGKKTGRKPVKKAAAIGKKPPIHKRIGRFFGDIFNELKRVSWPDRKQLFSSTAVILAIVVSVVIFVFIVDTILGGLLSLSGVYDPSNKDLPALPTPNPATFAPPTPTGAEVPPTVTTTVV